MFIHNGSLHIIPLPTNPLEAAILPTEKPGHANAYNLVTSTVINTKASKRIEECILKKIRWLGTIMQLLQIVFISVFWNTSKEFPNFFFYRYGNTWKFSTELLDRFCVVFQVNPFKKLQSGPQKKLDQFDRKSVRDCGQS